MPDMLQSSFGFAKLATAAASQYLQVHHADLLHCYRHLWYLVPQTVVFALADPGLTDSQREGAARKLWRRRRSKRESLSYLSLNSMERISSSSEAPSAIRLI